MTKDKQFEALAGIDGHFYQIYDIIDGTLYGSDFGRVGRIRLADYNSHDALQWIIDGLDGAETDRYIDYLFEIIQNEAGPLTTTQLWIRAVKATPAQKREAILRAKEKED